MGQVVRMYPRLTYPVILLKVLETCTQIRKELVTPINSYAIRIDEQKVKISADATPTAGGFLSSLEEVLRSKNEDIPLENGTQVFSSSTSGIQLKTLVTS
jgi:hypothetical protein